VPKGPRKEKSYTSTHLPAWPIKRVKTYIYIYINLETAVAQWLRCCATNWKVAGSIPDGVSGIFY